MLANKNFIVITGVDGSGKSTLVKNLQHSLNGLINVTVLNARSSSHRVKKLKLNHELPQRSAILSSAKLFVKAFLWWIKYYLKLNPLMRRGHIILCDRFYFDELQLDPLKYRYNAPKSITDFICRLIPKPSLYILLDAPEEVLYTRKQENTMEELHELRLRYLEWVKQQPHNFCIDATLPPPEVSQKIQKIIMEWIQGK